MDRTKKIVLIKKLFGKKADGTELTDGEVVPFLDVAESIVLNRYDPFGVLHEAPSRYDVVTCRIANFMLVKQGAEGEIQHTENGVTCIYGKADIPDELMREITPRAGVIGQCED